MTIDEMKQHEWVVGWSGGKDSTATIILMHEHNIPIKEIIYVRMMYDDNLPATLPVMTDFVDSAKEVFESWGYKVKIVPSIKTLIQMASRTYKRSKHIFRNGKPYGITSLSRGMCNMSDVKQRTIRAYSQPDEYHMIGYASDESQRIHRLNDTHQSIMVTLGVKEKDTFDICRKYNLLSPLYDLEIKRDGCWFCPNAGEKERTMLKENHPELYQKIVDLIEMCDYELTSLTKSGRNNWLTDYMKK